MERHSFLHSFARKLGEIMIFFAVAVQSYILSPEKRRDIVSIEINLNSVDDIAATYHVIFKNRIILPRYVVKLCGFRNHMI